MNGNLCDRCAVVLKENEGFRINTIEEEIRLCDICYTRMLDNFITVQLGKGSEFIDYTKKYIKELHQSDYWKARTNAP